MLPVNGLYGHIQRNALKSTLLLAAFVVMVAGIWYAWCLLYAGLTLHPPKVRGVRQALDLADYLEAARVVWLDRWYVPLFISAFWFATSFFFHSDMIRLGSGAEEADKRQYTRLYDIVERLAITAGLPMPRVEVMQTSALNAYASGLFPDDTVVAVTQGLIDHLDEDELEAVVAHELTHIKNRDVRLMVVATIFAGGLALAGSAIAKLLKVTPASTNSSDIVFLGSLTRGDKRDGNTAETALAIVVILLAVALMMAIKLLSTVAQFALSRAREYMADAGAIELTKNPEALIRALRKISGAETIKGLPAQLRPMMFSDSVQSWFSTHPSTEDRIQALVDHAGAIDEAPRTARPRSSGTWHIPGDIEAQAPAALGFAGSRGAFGKRRGLRKAV